MCLYELSRFLTSFTDSLREESQGKDDKMNKFKQMAVKAKRELENYRKQVREMSRSFVFFFFLLNKGHGHLMEVFDHDITLFF